MKLKLDGQRYYVDLEPIIIAQKVQFQQVLHDGIKLRDGRIIKLNGLLGTIISAFAAPTIIPIIHNLYRQAGLILDKPAKHADLFEYCTNALFDWMLIMEKRLDVNFTSEASEDNSRTIGSVTPIWETPVEGINVDAPFEPPGA